MNSNNKLMAELMAMALACNQTKVFIGRTHECDLRDVSARATRISITFTPTMSPSIRELGYQVISSKLAELSFRGYSDFIRALDAIKEGDGTLLDHTLVLGFSDTGYAKIHSTDNIPLFLAGGAQWQAQGRRARGRQRRPGQPHFVDRAANDRHARRRVRRGQHENGKDARGGRQRLTAHN